MPILGIDVSNHQPGIDFAKVKAAGYSYVVLKTTEGTVFTDPTMAANRRAAHAAGLIVGFYHFAGSSYYKQVYDPTAEATFFAKAIGTLQPGEFTCLDFEPFGYTNLGAYDMVQWARTWLNRTAALLGPNPFIYMAGAHLRGYNWTPIAATNGLWYAIYDQNQTAPTVPYWGAPAMKQFYDKATVPGVPSSPPCDVDVFFGGTAQLLAYGKNGTSPLPEDDMFSDTDRAWLEDVLRRVQSIHRYGFTALPDPAKNPPPDWRQGGDLSWLDQRQASVQQAIEQAVQAAVGNTAPVIDEAKLAAALLADPASVDALGKAIAAHLKLAAG